MIDIDELYVSRPFKVRNGDEYELTSILDVFVEPEESLRSPFEYENLIVKGRMGSGKTMFLRANYAFYLYTLVPSLLENKNCITIPIYIKLSDFQHIADSNILYKNIILTIIEEIYKTPTIIKDAEYLKKMHCGVLSLPDALCLGKKQPDSVLNKIRKMSADEYKEQYASKIEGSGEISLKYASLYGKYEQEYSIELRSKEKIGMADIKEAFYRVLGETDNRLLLLIDEAGAINKSFYKENQGESLFEVLMNQLRTVDFIRTKIAIYPCSYSDILTETRYGDVVYLQEDVMDNIGFASYFNKVMKMVDKYIKNEIEGASLSDLFETSEHEEYYTLEQLIYASYGNTRRLIQLLDNTMMQAYQRWKTTASTKKMIRADAVSALTSIGAEMEKNYNYIEKDFLADLVNVCRTRTAYKFRFPNKSVSLYKYAKASKEINIINILELGTGKKATTYAFDYSYCIFKDIPTHYIRGSEKIEKMRTRNAGDWIKKVTEISEERIVQAAFPGKVDGQVIWVRDGVGFMKDADQNEYFFTKDYIIEGDIGKKIRVGTKIRFFPTEMENIKFGSMIEVL